MKQIHIFVFIRVHSWLNGFFAPLAYTDGIRPTSPVASSTPRRRASNKSSCRGAPRICNPTGSPLFVKCTRHRTAPEIPSTLIAAHETGRRRRTSSVTEPISKVVCPIFGAGVGSSGDEDAIRLRP